MTAARLRLQKQYGQPLGAPSINWNNPLTYKLVSAISPLAMIDLVTRRPLVVVSSFATTVTRKGVGHLSNGTRYLYSNIATTTSNGLTYLMVGGFATSTTRVRGGLGNTAGNQIFGFQQNSTTASRALQRFTNGGGSTITNYTAFNSTTAQDVFVMRSTDAATLEVFYNGFNNSSVLTTASTGNAAFNTVGLGGARNNADNPGASGQESTLCLAWDRKLTDSEIFWISQNPWQVFRTGFPPSLNLMQVITVYGLASTGVGR